MMKDFVDKLRAKQDLSFDESKAAFEILMEGKANDQEIFDFLTLLSEKGETSNEIAGGVYILREKSKRVNVNNCIDTCGTGGDGMNTLNISTASALLLASMGVKVAKHGNKAVSSKCGSGDVLEALNIKIDLEPNDIQDQIKKNNFGFMFAPNYHSAMRFVGPTRKKIGKRTIFNMIGPLSSPALVKKQVVGVFDKKLLKIFANALNNLEIEFAWIVNSKDGLDEISPYAQTNITQLKDKKISEIIIDPKKLNVNADKFENLIGDDAKFNAEKMLNIFKGEDNDFSKAVCLNAAAGLIVNETHNDFNEAMIQAKSAVLGLLKSTIRPEFLNRIDDIIMFSPLTAKEIQSIVQLQFKILTQRLAQKELEVSASNEAIAALSQWGFDPEYGGRPVKRVIQKKVLNALSKELLAGKIDTSKPLLVDYFDDQIVFLNKEKIT